MKQLYSEAVNFLRDIGKEERVLIISHWDMDGVGSAAIVSRILRKHRGKEANFYRVPEDRLHGIDSKTEELVEKKKIGKLIVLDITPEYEALQKMGKKLGGKVIVIDHHNFDRIPENIIYVNPRVEKKDNYTSASKLCYDIALEFDLNLAWIAGFGIIQDFNVKGTEELFKELRSEYPSFFPEEINQQKLAKRSEYGDISKILNVKPYKNTQKKAELAYKLLMNINNLRDVKNSMEYYKLKETYLEMIEEVDKRTENYFEDRELDREKRVSFFTFKSDFHINSSIATSTSLKEPEWIHIIVKEGEDKVNISARCQSGRVNLGDVLKKSLPKEALKEGEAGGHRKAAGASFPKKYYREFKKNLLEAL